MISKGVAAGVEILDGKPGHVIARLRPKLAQVPSLGCVLDSISMITRTPGSDGEQSSRNTDKTACNDVAEKMDISLPQARYLQR
jgi:hypothetical protein